jgi:hypothetical protein
MKHLSAFRHQPSTAKQEQGIVMLLALMMGVVLIAGATGLMIRQMMARKIGIYSSYQAMADNAAVNGFNRILGTLNSPETDLGYLFMLDNTENIDPDTGSSSDNFLWEVSNPSVDEFCTDTNDETNQFPTHRTGSDWHWPTGRNKSDPGNATRTPITLSSIDEEGKETTLLRVDNARGIETSFQLRSYKLISFDQNKGQGKGVFEVEGLINRTNDDGSKNQVARALMTRYLDIFSTIDAPKNWAVIAGDRINLGPSTIHGDGLMAWITDEKPEDCSNLMPNLNRVETSATTKDPLVWPINRGLPTAVLFMGDGTDDVEPSATGVKRIWSFDDRELTVRADRGTTCTAVACTRAENTSNYNSPPITDHGEGSNIIKIKHDEICTDNLESNVCHIYVEHMHLSNTKVFIESTGSTNAIRKIVINLVLPTVEPTVIGEGGSIVISGNAQLCTSPSISPQTTPECGTSPEQLIIASSETMNSDWYSTTSCADPTNTVSFEGNTLPSAWLAMAQGTVRLTGDTALNGVIWARSICADGSRLDLYATSDTDITASTNSSADEIKNVSYVYDTAQAWDWNKLNFRGFGKTTLRGLRGEGLDTFQRF